MRTEFYLHSSKKLLPCVEKLPENAVYWKTVTSYVPEGIILRETRTSKKGTKVLYHVHKVGGSNPPYGKFGSHDIFIVR